MPRIKTLPKSGALVTVRLTDDAGIEHIIHGTMMETQQIVSVSYGFDGFGYTPAPLGDAPGTTWARIYSATGNPVQRDGLPERTLDYYFQMYEIWVNTEAATITLTKALKAGHKWVADNLSIDNRRQLLAEQVKALDPALGEAVDLLFGEIDEDAFDRGRDYEWRSVND